MGWKGGLGFYGQLYTLLEVTVTKQVAPLKSITSTTLLLLWPVFLSFVSQTLTHGLSATYLVAWRWHFNQQDLEREYITICVSLYLRAQAFISWKFRKNCRHDLRVTFSLLSPRKHKELDQFQFLRWHTKRSALSSSPQAKLWRKKCIFLNPLEIWRSLGKIMLPKLEKEVNIEDHSLLGAGNGGSYIIRGRWQL